jgi:glutathione S-transferase
LHPSSARTTFGMPDTYSDPYQAETALVFNTGVIFMELYSTDLSGHSHRARLFLSLLGVEHEVIPVDLAKRAHKEPEFLDLNPFGQVPVLVDGDTVVTDSNAILVYLAKKFGRSDWLPEDAAGAARVQKWLSVAAGEIARGPNSARLAAVFNAPLDAEDAIRRSHAILTLIDAELAVNEYIAGGTPTIADVALYSYIARAPEGHVDLSGYPNVNVWLIRVEGLPGFASFTQTQAISG